METTLNIHFDILERISFAAQQKNISRSNLIIHLMKIVMDDISDPGRIGKMVKYQSKSSPENWHTFHLYLKADEYEYLLDLKKLLKMSVSLILAHAVKKFLGMILKTNITDNYRYQNYIIDKELIGTIICWKFIWGFPPNIEKYINIPYT